MPYWNRSSSYKVDQAILKSVENVSTPISATIFASDIGFQPDGSKIAEAGLFVGRYADKYRFIPRGRLTAAVLAAGNNFTVDKAYLFKVGDPLFLFDTTSASPALVDAGIIQSINFVTKVITTNGTAVADRAIGFGVQTPPLEYVGIYAKSIDFANRPSESIGVITVAEAVYELALPHYDEELKARMADKLGIRKFVP